MAMFPCDKCGNRYIGRQQTIYVHLVKDGTELGRKLRLCPVDFQRLYHLLYTTTLVTLVGDEATQFESDDTAPVCMDCKSIGDGSQVYAFGYPNNDQRRGFWGRVCNEHTDNVLSTFKIAP